MKILAIILATTMVVAGSYGDVFGTGGNQFTIDFVTIGNANNAADGSGYGAVNYSYEMGVNEVSREMIVAYTNSVDSYVDMEDMTEFGGDGANQPATGVSWNEAARFVNWLNTSQGYQAAYKFTSDGANAYMLPWSSAEAWQQGGENLFRHKDTVYFLPSEDEWYKAAYYDGTTYFDYATGQDIGNEPTAVASGTAAGTAVYDQATDYTNGSPASIYSAGGLSPYGTMAQTGNVYEWTETGEIDPSDSSFQYRMVRGSSWLIPSAATAASETRFIADDALRLRSSEQIPADVFTEWFSIGFRVARVDEDGEEPPLELPVAINCVDRTIKVVRNVSATDGDFDDRVVISWQPVEGAMGYAIYRLGHTLLPLPQTIVSGDTFLQNFPTHNNLMIGQTSANVLEFVDFGADEEYGTTITTEYYYWVKAIVGNCVSTPNSYDSGYTAPRPVSQVSATQGEYKGRVEVSYESVRGAVFYKLYRSEDAGFTNAQLIVTQTAGSSATGIADKKNGIVRKLNDKSAIAGQHYFYAVRAIGLGGSRAEDSPVVEGWVSELEAELRTLTVHHASPSLGSLWLNDVEITSFPLVADYDEGSELNLHVVPNATGVFVNWSGDIDSANSTNTFFLDENMTVTANFLGLTDFVTEYPGLDPNEDSNGNGNSNFLVYASGQNPEVAGTLPIVELRDGLLTMRRRINGQDASPLMEYSDNLSEWLPMVEGIHYTVISRTADGEMLTLVMEPADGPETMRFFRQTFEH